MTILVRCYGDQRYGLGHVARSMTLCRALQHQGLMPSCILLEDETGDVPAICAANGVPVLPLSVDPPLQFDFLIYDMPFIEHEILTLLKAANPNGRVIALDFDDYEYENVDHVFNLYNHGDFSLSESNTRTKFESGFHLAIIREGFFPYRLNGVAIAELFASVLVSFGGSDPSGNTLKTLDALRAFPEKKVVILRGQLFRHEEQLIKSAQESGLAVDIAGPVADIERWMAEADVVICGGGTTMLEAMFLGRPTIVLPQSVSEQVFAGEATAKAACLLADPAVAGDLAEKIAFLDQRTNRKRLSRNAMELVDGQGVDVILADIVRGTPPPVA